jgi:prepilin-type N-terminal cleavage/methylation domain-containing protein
MKEFFSIYKKSPRKFSGGFTLIESLVGVAIFVMLAGVVYETFFIIARQASYNWENTTVSALASQYLETTRNLPYAEIGTVAGNPNGDLPDSTSPTPVTISSKTYEVYYEVAYLDDPADGTALLGTDPTPSDYKQVKLSVRNTTTGIVTSFFTNIVPTGLESLTAGGALALSVIDAVGQPVPSATINITNTAVSPALNLTRTTNANGIWVEVGLPNSPNSYHITATKNGYSSDQTYPITVGNPDPVKPDATITNGQITAISFAIDRTSDLTFNTLNQACSPLSDIGLAIQGAKIIGTPNVLKYDATFTSNGSGQISLPSIEWDNYTPTLIGSTYMIYGSSPIQQINILPNTSQIFNFILGAKTTHSLLVIVKDTSTGNPVEGATVTLTNTSPAVNESKITGGSLWSQQYWNGGSGQALWTDTTKYFQDNGSVSTTDMPLAMRLIESGGTVISTDGNLESSTFDTGSTTSDYTTLTWEPASQDPAVTVKFQIATNNDNATWDYVGPDGTASTYYTTPNTTVGSSNNNNRYVRYKAYLSTTDTSKNPTITSVGINYISGCFTPGQVMFPGLTTSTSYQVEVSMPGYLTQTISDLEVNGYQTLEVLLSTT